MMPFNPQIAAQEATVRAELRRGLGINISIIAPPWSKVLLMQKPLSFAVPAVPDGVEHRLTHLEPQSFRQDQTGLSALAIAERLQKQLPEPVYRASIAPGRPHKAPRGSGLDWRRALFLATGGPDVTRLLAAARYLTNGDLDALTQDYPMGLEGERIAATAAARDLITVANRSHQEPGVSDWVNDQMILLMGDETPASTFQALYADKPKPGPGPAVSGAPSKIAQAYRPTPGQGDATQ